MITLPPNATLQQIKKATDLLNSCRNDNNDLLDTKVMVELVKLMCDIRQNDLLIIEIADKFEALVKKGGGTKELSEDSYFKGIQGMARVFKERLAKS